VTANDRRQIEAPGAKPGDLVAVIEGDLVYVGEVTKSGRDGIVRRWRDVHGTEHELEDFSDRYCPADQYPRVLVVGSWRIDVPGALAGVDANYPDVKVCREALRPFLQE